MRKGTLLLVAVFLLTSTPAFAHCGVCGVGEAKGSKGSGSEDWVQKKTDKLTKKLGLSETQSAQVKALLEEKKAAKEAMHKNFQEGLDAILTAEQKEKHKAMMDEKGSKKGSHKGSGHDHDHDHGSKKGS